MEEIFAFLSYFCQLRWQKYERKAIFRTTEGEKALFA